MKTPLLRCLAIASGAALVGVSVIAAQPATQPPAKPAGQPPAPDTRPARPAPPDGEARPGRGDRQGGAPANLEGSMKLMNRSYKQLNDQITDPAKRDENLRLIGEMQRGCVGAKSAKIEPPRDKPMDEAAKAKMAAYIRRHLIETMRKLLDVEQSIVDGKLEAAKTGLDEVRNLRQAAHKELEIKEDQD